MPGRFRPPLYLVAVALLGLIALLATLQYRWVGRISDAERDHMRATLNTRASGFGQDFDGELTRAYLLFQVEPQADADLEPGVARRYDRWQSTARYPRIIKDVYSIGPEMEPALRRFNPATRALEPVEWPAAFEPIHRTLIASREPSIPAAGFILRQLPSPLWEQVPALLIPTPVIRFNEQAGRTEARFSPSLTYTVVQIDRNYVTHEMLPALAQQHFRQTGDGFDYQLAVVSPADRATVYQSSPAFSPDPDAQVDARVDLFQVRLQDFGSIVSEVRQFTSMFTAGPLRGLGTSTTVREQIVLPPDARPSASREGPPVSIIVQQSGPLKSVDIAGGAAATARLTATGSPRWRLLVKHPAGSLEEAVDAARRRNLIISTSILSVLGASIGLLVLSTRRAQELARQQMEFVAAVSHELRTPLAVIRSAGDNLADGVVRDDDQIRKYGDLVRSEGRRLTEMVEQILEFAGIESGQRGFALRPLPVAPLLREVVESSRALLESGGMEVEFEIPDGMPPVLGDEAALRRVFGNLIANAIKYGQAGRWIGIRARPVGRDVHITIADRGIGIAPGEQARIFEPFYRTPDVIAARIQGAGLGLSLVQRTVEAHGGQVGLKSTVGAGSEFTVVLPAASGEPVAAPEIPDPGPRIPDPGQQGHGSHA